jgi:hypothetical protein
MTTKGKVLHMPERGTQVTMNGVDQLSPGIQEVDIDWK